MRRRFATWSFRADFDVPRAPNDDRQNEGLDLSHHMMYLAHDHKLYLAPIKQPHKVLDVGTGTGIWAM